MDLPCRPLSPLRDRYSLSFLLAVACLGSESATRMVFAMLTLQEESFSVKAVQREK
jgi:hypothetical protein